MPYVTSAVTITTHNGANMRKYTITDRIHGIELCDLSISDIEIECPNISDNELSAVACLAINNSVTFDPKWCITTMTNAVTFSRTE